MQTGADYPLTGPWTLAGLAAGAFLGVTTDNLLVALAVCVLVVGTGIVWRRGDPAVLPFILTYQWLSITAGYWYQLWYGVFPGEYRPGDVERTMALALTGLLLLAVGMRVAAQVAGAGNVASDVTEARPPLVRPLFLIVMAVYAVDYVYPIEGRAFGRLTSIVQRVLEFRQILLVALWVEVLRTRRHLPLVVVTFGWVVAPRLGTYFSDFKTPVILMLIALAAGWQPWARGWWRRAAVAGAKAAPLVAALLVMLLVWQGGVKRETRAAIERGVVERDAPARLGLFADLLRNELPHLFDRPEPYVRALVERVSYITFFSRVLDHVPDREPHARGELWRMAIQNAIVPRLLVPDKPELPSDSYYTRRFAGVPVADRGTSVSIGYMAEFYADWGLGGMYASILAYGLWIGLVGALVGRLTVVPGLTFATMTTVLLSVAEFEQQFIKGFAALNLTALMMLAMVFALRPWLMRLMGERRVAQRGDAVPPGATQ